ncbi:hypothetical protein CBR_g78863 [Chara braunii]|uniref:Uncharacterized protein n=1 Tax=Chara braunii TaxID=69332 RepID=A0A388KAJ0_CHABU|nr:hypothetical protein CBR_g78863 [Chara braunii]|eukprot:GBG67082.1 hypothetical protein CBR_g78863 [Chara braunii]
MSWTAQQRGGKSVAGAESAYDEEVGDMQGARELQAESSELQAESSSPFSPTGATSAYPSASPASSTESSPSSSLPEPSTKSSSSSSSPSPSPPAVQSTGASSAAGELSSAGRDGSGTGVSGRLADTLSSPSPRILQTPPRGGVSVGVLAGSLVAACLVASVLGGALVLLVSRSRKSAKAESGGMTATFSALEHPVERCSALERPI